MNKIYELSKMEISFISGGQFDDEVAATGANDQGSASGWLSWASEKFVGAKNYLQSAGGDVIKKVSESGVLTSASTVPVAVGIFVGGVGMFIGATLLTCCGCSCLGLAHKRVLMWKITKTK